MKKQIRIVSTAKALGEGVEGRQEARGAETKKEYPERTDSHDSVVTRVLRVIMGSEEDMKI